MRCLFSVRIARTCIIVVCIISAGTYTRAWSQADRSLYHKAARAAEKGRDDFAFMLCDQLAREFPDSEYTKTVFFALGEYYYHIHDYRNAAAMLWRYTEAHPDSDPSPFAYAYLIKLAQRENDAARVEELEAKIIGFTQASLMFREFKEYTYTSFFKHDYRIVYFIDKVEIYVDGALLHEIPL